MTLLPTNTIEEAKTYLRNNFSAGLECPCCGQRVKLEKRKLNSGMARTLAYIYNHHPCEWIDVKDFLRQHKYKNAHDWTQLRHWKFIESGDNKDDAKGRTGTWRITTTGKQFIRGEIKVRSHIFTFDNRFYGFSDAEIDIIEALGNHFSYRELMGIEKPVTK